MGLFTFLFFLASPRRSKSGQTSVEYILLVLVMVTIGMTLFGRIKGWMAGEADNCTPQSTSLSCRMATAFPSGGYGSYRFYRF